MSAPPDVKEESRRRPLSNAELETVARGAVPPQVARCVDHLPPAPDVLRGGTPAAIAMYRKLHWETNESRLPAVDW